MQANVKTKNGKKLKVKALVDSGKYTYGNRQTISQEEENIDEAT